LRSASVAFVWMKCRFQIYEDIYYHEERIDLWNGCQSDTNAFPSPSNPTDLSDALPKTAKHQINNKKKRKWKWKTECTPSEKKQTFEMFDEVFDKVVAFPKKCHHSGAHINQRQLR